MEENGNYEVEVLKVDSKQTLNVMGSAYGPESASISGPTPKGSVEDLSDYQDADESVSSAPTEFLAEFLSSVMLKDYENALKYCNLILQYEPENAAAKEFYPLIVEKLKLMAEENENENETSSSSSDDSSTDSDEADRITSETDSEATTASYSSLEDEEAEPIAMSHFSDSNGNPTSLNNPLQLPFPCTSSDSESPTEPISTQLINQLRAKVTTKAKCN